MSEVTSFTVASVGGKILPELIRRSLYWRIGCLTNDAFHGRCAVDENAETFDSQRMELRYRQVKGCYLLFFFFFRHSDLNMWTDVGGYGGFRRVLTVSVLTLMVYYPIQSNNTWWNWGKPHLTSQLYWQRKAWLCGKVSGSQACCEPALLLCVSACCMCLFL